MTIPPPLTRRVGKTVALLASPQDGEVLAAARALGRLLEGAGMDHHALAALVVGEMERRSRPPFTFASLAPRTVRKQMAFLAWREGVTPAERARLETLRERLLKQEKMILPPEEIAWADAVWRRAMDGGAA